MSIKESLNFQLNSDIDIQINVWNYSCFYQVKDFFSLKKVKRTKKKKKKETNQTKCSSKEKKI